MMSYGVLVEMVIDLLAIRWWLWDFELMECL